MIYLEVKGKIPSQYYSKTDIKNTIENVLAILNIKGDFGVEVLFISEKGIQELNKTFRNIDKPTDVLSFPQQKNESLKFNILGSIVICGKIALERKESLEELIKHSMLHLLGYDHDTDEEAWDEVAKKIDCNF